MAFRLRPVEHGFFPLFARAGENIKAATHALALMVAADPGARAGLARRVKDAELAGDGLTREIFVKLNSTFVTPFDREDIYRLTAALDHALDDPGVTKTFRDAGLGVRHLSSAELLRMLHEQYDRWGPFIRSIGLKPQ